MSKVELSVGGASRAAANTFERTNPVTGEVATKASAASPEDATAAFTELRWITMETELGHYPI